MGIERIRRHWIFPERNLVYVRFKGKVRREDTFEFAQELAADPLYRPGLDELIDARNCVFEGGFSDALEYRNVLRDIRPSTGKGRWACVVSGDLMYGLSRMFGTLAGALGVEMRPFRNIADALAWLGMEDFDLPEEQKAAS